MISVPEFMATSSMPRLVQDSAHHLYVPGNFTFT